MRRDRPNHASVSAGYTRPAFTLIEVMIATGIIVALLAVATPVLVSSFGDRRIEAEAERLGAVMASLRAEAARTRESLALHLIPADGSYGGEVLIGPFERPDETAAFNGMPSNAPIEQSEYRERVVFEAKRPLRLSVEQPSNDVQRSLQVTGSASSVPEASIQPERIRIAVCTASGQILASRPLWLSDGRSMYSVEVGSGVGNAVLSSRRIIPEFEPLPDDSDVAGEVGQGDRSPGLEDGANP